MIKKLHIFFWLTLFASQMSFGQLFDNQKNIQLATQSVDFIYNMQPDSAIKYMDSLESSLPNHPIVPMLKAVNLLWQSIPYVTVDTTFEVFKNHLYEVVEKARWLDGGKQEETEAIFFEMAARGLLAEYYADADNYMKAVNEASKAYGLLKKAFDKTEEIPDFLFTVGIYNYFREAYPELYPVYKPFVWVFRGGDKKKGIQQLVEAGDKALIVKVEAYIYLAYIYLRYEFKPAKAQGFLQELVSAYPANTYIRAKYLESMAVNAASYQKIRPSDFELLKNDGRPYFLLASFAFEGLYNEWETNDLASAERLYKQALSIGLQLKTRGEYLKSLCYLGLGRMAYEKADHDLARYYLLQSRDIAETDDIKKEVGELMDKIGE